MILLHGGGWLGPCGLPSAVQQQNGPMSARFVLGGGG
jgi:hypothetical protein